MPAAPETHCRLLLCIPDSEKHQEPVSPVEYSLGKCFAGKTSNHAASKEREPLAQSQATQTLFT